MYNTFSVVILIFLISFIIVPSLAVSETTLAKPVFWTDPLKTTQTVSTTAVAKMLKEEGEGACVFPDDNKLFTLEEVVERALCHNPQTREAWATAKVRAAELGAGRSAYLPTVEGSAPLAWRNTHIEGNGTNSHERVFDTLLSFNYLLFNFTREATVETLKERLKAANWEQNVVLQDVFLSAVTAYYQLFSANEAVEAIKQAETYSLENLKAATIRLAVGVSTVSDRLQAATAASQATLNRVRAEGDARIAMGNLSNIMGIEAGTSLNIASPQMRQPEDVQEEDVKLLIEQAKKMRPDLLEAEAQVKAARANIRAVRGEGLPSLSLVGSHSTSRSNRAVDTRGSTIGVTASFPLFSGFNNHYRTQVAKSQLESQIAMRDLINNQVALDVWSSYYDFLTETEALKASADLFKSATESEKVARERYQAGVGNILELLNAEADLASAQLQHIQSRYNWYIVKATLARAIGTLDYNALSF